MALIPASRSLLDLAALAAWTDEQYALAGPARCSLIRFNWNDTYLVWDSAARYILRVYGREHRNADDIARELEVVRHLSRSGVHACAALPARDGRFVLELQAAEGVRHAVLFEYACGRVVVPRTEPDAKLLGSALAQLHTAGDHFDSSNPQPVRDLAYLLDQPLAHLDAMLPGRDADAAFVRDVARRVRDEIASRTDLDWGVIHGDPFSNNATVTDGGEVMWYDFDNSGLGYRAQDFVVPFWSARSANAPSVFDAFLGGYRNHRLFDEGQLGAVPALCVAQFIRTLWEVPAARAPLHGAELAQAIVDARVKQIRAAVPWLAS